MEGTLLTAANILVGTFFMISGSLKLPDLEGFTQLVSSYSLVPGQIKLFVQKAAYLIPALEIAAGSLLIAGIYPIPSLIVLGGTLSVYTFVLIFEFIQEGQKDNCGCYGTQIESPLSKQRILENTALLSLIIISLFVLV